ncbi:MAG: carbonic anhydrase [Sideroxydans sp.]|nr:carbonic anhydrase [Sideroxydans sp.]
MNYFRTIFLICGLALGLHAQAEDTHETKGAADQNTVIINFLNELKADNSVYMVQHKIEFFAGLSKGQTPKATVVTCADSRVQANMFDRAPEGDLFTIRNIGNQLVTAEGSVEYGVHHLHTPILLFIGHSRCGAIAAVGGNYSKESAAIKKELDTIDIPADIGNMEGVKANVNNQVTGAMEKFSEEIESGHLVVIGAVMDFADDLHQGAGKLHVININGKTDSNLLENARALLTPKKAKVSSEPRPEKHAETTAVTHEQAEAPVAKPKVKAPKKVVTEHTDSQEPAEHH